MHTSTRSKKILALLMAITSLLTIIIMALTYGNGQELVRLRNSFLAEMGTSEDFSWTPSNIPSNFLLEKNLAPSKIQDIVDNIRTQLTFDAGEFETALSLARHLGVGPHPHGSGIQSNTLDTYETIINSDKGFCADYSQTLNALSIAANISIREWGMSFDGFGGKGHAFNEIYDNQIGKWIFIDSYYSFYVIDINTNTPLSVIELQRFLRSGKSFDFIDVIPIKQSHFKFKTKEKALNYYKRGSDQFYLYLGNNVYSYDKHPTIKILGGISRALEQSAAIALGIHPEIRIVPTDTNEKWVDYLFHKRKLFFLGIAVLFIASSVLFFTIRALIKTPSGK